MSAIRSLHAIDSPEELSAPACSRAADPPPALDAKPGPRHGRRAGTGPIALVGCGARKAARPATPGELYTGSYFRACLQAALAVAPRSRVIILSARHGLLGLDDEPIAPYQITIGDPGSVSAATVKAQAAARGIAGAPVVALCGARYASLALQAWTEVSTPLAGLGIGRQLRLLAAIRDEASNASGNGAERGPGR
jgi:hypothetical protein